MLPEALVIFACINNSGCTETSSLYFSQNPQVKAIIDMDAQELRKTIGPKTVDVVGPFLFFAAGGNGVIRLDKNFSLNANKSGGTLLFRIDL